MKNVAIDISSNTPTGAIVSCVSAYRRLNLTHDFCPRGCSSWMLIPLHLYGSCNIDPLKFWYMGTYPGHYSLSRKSHLECFATRGSKLTLGCTITMYYVHYANYQIVETHVSYNKKFITWLREVMNKGSLVR